MKNNNGQGEGFEVPAGWGNPDDVFGNETKLTRIIGAPNEQQKEEDPFGGKTSQTLHFPGVDNPPKIKPEDIIDISTLKTMKESVSNPDNKNNPFDNPIDPFGGETIKFDPMDKSLKKINADPFEKGASNEDPFGGKTLDVDPMDKKNQSINTKGKDPFEKGAKNEDPFGGETLKEEIKMKNESVKKTRVDPFEPGAKIEDPFGGETLK